LKSQASSVVADRQATLCRSYSERPEEAISVKRVATVPGPNTDALHGTAIAPDFPGTRWDYGIDSKVGGFDDLPNPGHLLCAALAACMDSTLRMIADRLGVGIDHLEVVVNGDVDVRGCLAMDASIRPGFRRIRCDVRLRPAPTASRRSVDILLTQTERLCVTLETLRNGVPVTVASEVEQDSPATAGDAVAVHLNGCQVRK
jgi:uncharacterized OsmC-like protein